MITLQELNKGDFEIVRVFDKGLEIPCVVEFREIKKEVSNE